MEPLEFLAVEIVDGGPQPIHEGDQLGGLHAGQVVQPHVGIA